MFKGSKYPEVKEAIFDMFLHQFNHYYESDTSKSPPLHFERCVEVSSIAVAVKKVGVHNPSLPSHSPMITRLSPSRVCCMREWNASLRMRENWFKETPRQWKGYELNISAKLLQMYLVREKKYNSSHL